MLYKRVAVIIFGFILYSLIFFPSSLFANSIPDQSHSSLSVSSSVPADGKTTAIVTVTLHDSADNPVVGNAVVLSDSSNSGVTITTMQGTTDVSGHALFSIKSTKAQTDNLDLTDTTSNIKFFTLGKITFTTAGCYDSPPGSAPQLISATGTGANQIMLTWTQAANPVSNYLVSYGLTSGQYIYGNPNVGGQGTTSYSVGSLSPGKRYYFVVQAGNGCTPGSFSNEISATAGNTSSTLPTSTQTLPIVAPSTTIPNIIEPTTIIILKPTGIPISPQNMQPTISSAPKQISASDSFMSAVLLSLSVSILVIGSIGNYLYWQHKKNEFESVDIREESE